MAVLRWPGHVAHERRRDDLSLRRVRQALVGGVMDAQAEAERRFPTGGLHPDSPEYIRCLDDRITFEWGAEYGHAEATREAEAALREKDEAMLAWEPLMRLSLEGEYLLNDEGGLYGCVDCGATSRGMALSGGEDEHRDPFYHDADCKVVQFLRALGEEAGT